MMPLKKYLLLPLLLINLLAPAVLSSPASAQNTGICDRTQPIQDLLLDKLPDIDDCSAVTTADLANITGALSWGNQNISTITSTDLNGLSNVTGLYLSRNNLTNISANSFASLNSLTTLSLSNNQISSIATDAFASLSNLKYLHLFNNQISTIQSDHFTALSNLETLSLYNNRLLTLPANAFSALSKLQRLRLSDNRISNITTDAFASLSNLETLDLDGNRLTILPANIFAALSNLDTLNLDHNQISSIATDAFASLSNLDYLSMYNNSLTTISANAFASLSNLRTLLLDKNGISSIATDAFASLSNLKTLNLDGNLLIDISANAFAPLNELENLELSNNLLENISANAFAGLSNLEELELKNNNLTSIPSDAFAPLSNLDYLSLHNNNLTSIPADAFTALIALKTLKLGYNRISNVSIDAFTDLTATSIDLRRNAITALPLNLLASHTNPNNIYYFPLRGNSLTDDTWEITRTSWKKLTDNTAQLIISHILPQDITVKITSTTGRLSSSSLTIPKGETASPIITWTGNNPKSLEIIPDQKQINVPILNGHINIGQLDIPPTFNTELANHTVTAEYAFNPIELPAASGGSHPLTYSLFETNSNGASSLPADLIFNNTTRELSGSVNTAGNYSLTYSVVDANDLSVTGTFMLIAQPNLRPAFVPNNNQSYSFLEDEAVEITLPATSAGNGPITYALNASEDLPAGLVFNATERTITGYTSEVGTYNFMFIATDTFDDDTASLNLTIAIEPDLSLRFDRKQSFTNKTARQDTSSGLSITLPTVLNGNGSLSYSFQTNETEGLPAGLIFDDDSRMIRGQPTVFGDFNISVTLTDADSNTSSFSFILKIIERLGFEPALDERYIIDQDIDRPLTLPTGKGGVPGVAGNYTYALIGDSLDGISFDPITRIISTNSVVTGDYSATYQVTDAEDISFEKDIILVIKPPPPMFPPGQPAREITVLVGQTINMTLPEVNTHSITTITYTISNLPDLAHGLAFNPDTRQLTGSIAQVGSYHIIYHAVDLAYQQRERSFTINVIVNPVVIQDILWRQALTIADQTVNSVKKRFDLIDRHRLPYETEGDFQGANFQVTKSNWLGLWINIGSSNLENSQSHFKWDGSTDNRQFGVDFSGKNYLVGLMSESVSTNAAFTVEVEALNYTDNNYTGNLDISNLDLLTLYGGYYQDKYNVWAVSSSGSGSADLLITANASNSRLSSGVDYAMTAIGGSYKITDLLDVGFEGITSASLDLANNAISNITSNSASRNKLFGSIDFGRWTNKLTAQSAFSWKPSIAFALRSDSGDNASGSTSGLELTAAVELEYKIVHFEFSLRTFNADDYSDSAKRFTFHLIPGAATGLNLELTQRLGDTESVANSIFNNAELNDIVDGMSQSTELSSIGKISYGWAMNTGTYRLFTQGQSQVNHAQTEALFGDVSAMFGSEAGIVWDSIGIAFDSSDNKFSWTSNIQGGMINKYFNNLKDDTEATTVNFTAEIKF